MKIFVQIIAVILLFIALIVSFKAGWNAGDYIFHKQQKPQEKHLRVKPEPNKINPDKLTLRSSRIDSRYS